ncbi:MAG: NUDIX hydrolase [Nitrospiria bacterium]
MKQEIYKGDPVHLFTESVTLPNGKKTTLEIIRHPGAAAVVPLLSDGTVVLIRQYRYAAGGFIYEIPAGKRSKGESPESCALREVEEETGYRVGTLKKLTAILTVPGFCDEVIHLYLGTNLVACVQQLDEDEVIQIIKIPIRKAMKMIVDQHIRDAKTIVALQLAYAEAQRSGLIKTS